MKKVFAVTAAIMLLCLVSGSAFAGWTVINLNPAGANSSVAYGVGGGQQAGYAPFEDSDNPGFSWAHAALWGGSAGSFVDLNPSYTAGGQHYEARGSYVFDVSGGQQVGNARVGSDQFAEAQHAALWSGFAGSFVDLNPYTHISEGKPVYASDSNAHGVSGGQQVGVVTSLGYYNGPDWIYGTNHASLWSGSAASWVDLSPAGSDSSEAFGVGGGQQVGYAESGDGSSHAALWNGTAGSFVDLDPAGSYYSQALGVSGGQQVGAIMSQSDGYYHASLWSGSATSWVDLDPAGSNYSVARGISGGWQVGEAGYASWQSRASLWNGTAESWVDLHALLPAGVYPTSRAWDIEVSGGEIWVAGEANIYSESLGYVVPEAMLWHYTPDVVPEPSSLLALGGGMIGLIGMIRRKK